MGFGSLQVYWVVGLAPDISRYFYFICLLWSIHSLYAIPPHTLPGMLGSHNACRAPSSCLLWRSVLHRGAFETALVRQLTHRCDAYAGRWPCSGPQLPLLANRQSPPQLVLFCTW